MFASVTLVGHITHVHGDVRYNTNYKYESAFELVTTRKIKTPSDEFVQKQTSWRVLLDRKMHMSFFSSLVVGLRAIVVGELELSVGVYRYNEHSHIVNVVPSYIFVPRSHTAPAAHASGVTKPSFAFSTIVESEVSNYQDDEGYDADESL